MCESKKTPAYALHVRSGAAFTDFAGWTMPLRYPDGTLNEHRHVRSEAGLFDISHMGQIALKGKNRLECLERLTPAAIVDLAPGRQCYALLTNTAGGIIDDIVVANIDDALILVVNAARHGVVLDHLTDALQGSCEVSPLSDLALLALQGPRAAEILAKVAPECVSMSFQSVAHLAIDGVRCRVSRSGYTGEDGFEIALPTTAVAALASRLAEDSAVRWVGLAARDSLRLEAGLCLYGHDITENTTVLSAGLGWTWPAARRGSERRRGGFPGAHVLERELTTGSTARRVGLLPDGRAVLRENTEVLNADGLVVGRITSGLHSPTLNRPIAMGYVQVSHLQTGAASHAVLRGKSVPMTVTSLPFVSHRYCRG